MAVFSPNKTSARLLVEFAAEQWLHDNGDPDDRKRYLLVYDLFIKARSYAIINKIAFWFSIVAGILVAAWPSIAVVSAELMPGIKFLESAVIQTSVTALAALTFAVYAFYKKRQMSIENLMRSVVYSDLATTSLADKVVKEMERIDVGFSFSESVPKKDKGAGKG